MRITRYYAMKSQRMAQRSKIKDEASFAIPSGPIIIMTAKKGMSRRYHGIGFSLLPCLISKAIHFLSQYFFSPKPICAVLFH